VTRHTHTSSRSPVHERDRGAALLIAIGFMVLVGLIVGALSTLITSGVGDSVNLKNARNRQYAADAAVQQDMVQLRTALVGNANPTWCSAAHTYSDAGTPSIKVACTSPTFSLSFSNGVIYAKRNVSFLACTDTSVACSDSSPTLALRAEVTFSKIGNAVTTYVQSWSVIK
jgi:Tfp pilus assembly protein PilX